MAFRADQKRFHVEQKRPTWKRVSENGPTWKRFPMRVLVKRFHVRHHVRPPEYPENRATWKRLSATENVSTSVVFCAGRSARKGNVSSVTPASGFTGSLNGSASWSEAAITHTLEHPTEIKQASQKNKNGLLHLLPNKSLIGVNPDLRRGNVSTSSVFWQWILCMEVKG